MRATLLREKITEIISKYGDIDLCVVVSSPFRAERFDIDVITVPSVRDFEKEDKGDIYLK